MPPKRWSLGKLGVPINIVAILYLIIALIMSFFPLVTPVTAQTMNWGIVMYVGVILIALVDYAIRGRHFYEGPVVLVKAIE